MNKSETRAREFLSQRIKLEPVDVEQIGGCYYHQDRLDNCDIFWILSCDHIGASDYIAVPYDGSPPFCFSAGE